MEQAQYEQQFITQFPFLSKEDRQHLFDLGKLEGFKNRQSIIKAGKKINSLYFILDGMVRGFAVDEAGEERTVFLRPAKTFFTAPEVLQNQVYSKYHFESINTTQLLVWPYEAFDRLANTHLSIARLYVEALKENVLTLVFRVDMLAGRSPEERYETLIQQNPQFFQETYHKYIANYLGITPNSLSRIIKRKKEGKGK